MRIEGPDRARTVSSSRTAKQTRRKAAAASTVQVAEAAALREKARALLQAAPEARIEKIAALRDAIERGEYAVPAKEVAKKVVLYALAEGYGT